MTYKTPDLRFATEALCMRHPITIHEKIMFLNYGNDADYVAVTNSGQVYEYELKISRSDYLRDVNKQRHGIYSRFKDKDFKGRVPNRFWYVTLPGIVRDDLPPYAGLYECVEHDVITGYPVLVEKVKAPLLWRGKHDIKTILKLASAMKARGGVLERIQKEQRDYYERLKDE